MKGFYAEDGVQLFFISSEDRKKKKQNKNKNPERLDLHQERLRLEMKEQVLVVRHWNQAPRKIMKSPSLEFLN